MVKKFSDVFGSIKYAKMDPKHNKTHVGGSTDDEEHGAVSDLEFDQQVKHAKKRSMTESESVKRTQTNLKNIETSKTGYSVDDEQYRKHIERMKKSRDEYIKNNPNSIYAIKKEEAESIEEKSDQAQQNKTKKNTMDASRGARWKIRNSMTGDSVRDWDNKHPNAQAQNKAIGRALRDEDVEPTSEQIEEAIDHIITARQIIGSSKNVKGGSHEYMKFLKQLRDKFGKEYSTNVHQTASKLAQEAKDPFIAKAKEDNKKALEALRTRLGMNKPENKGPKTVKKDGKEIYESYKLYHNTYSDAVAHAREHLKKKGLEISDDEWFRHVNSGPKKPSEGKTNRLDIPLQKDGKETKKNAHIQVYNRGKNYELNMYHESVEINESRQADIVREAFTKAKNKKKDEKNDKNVSGKVEKYEADPELTDTLQKQ